MSVILSNQRNSTSFASVIKMIKITEETLM